MSIAQRLVNLSDGLTVDGVLSAAKGGTGNTTGGGSSVPTISAISYGGDDTATNPAGGATITLTGTNFASGAKVLINSTQVSVVTVVSATQITFTAPANSAGSYILYVVNLDGSTAIAVPGIQYSGVPAWSTAAGTLGTSYETTAISTTVSATSNSAVTYSLASGTLPTGVTVNSNGTISGTSAVVSGSTTYTFTIRATDAELQDTDRSFSLTINPDVVTWVSPLNGGTVNSLVGNSSSTTLSATSIVGNSISYSSSTLPAGLSLSGSTISGTPTTTGTSSVTLTATAANSTKNSQIIINWTISVANDIYWTNTTTALTAENSVAPFNADASTNNFEIAVSGDTTHYNFNPYTPGYYSNYFDGTGDYLTTPASSMASIIGTSQLTTASVFTIECWINQTSRQSHPDAPAVVGDMLPTAATNNWSFGPDADGKLSFCWSSIGAYVKGNTIIPLNKWTHIAVVINAGNIKLFVDGVLQTLTGVIQTINANVATSGYITIGQWNSGGSLYGHVGYVSNLRIVKSALYSTNFVPSTSPLTAIADTGLLTCQSFRYIDNSSNAHALTPAGNIAVKEFQPFEPSVTYKSYGSAYFDGTGDYLATPSSASNSFGAGDFTAEAWVHPTVANTTFGAGIVGTYDGGSNGGWCLIINRANSGPIGLGFQHANANISTYGTYLPANAWTHVAVSRSGSTLRLFVNGTIVTTTTYATADSIVGPIYIGSKATTDGTFHTGYISDVRFVKGTCLYTTNFTLPTQPVAAVTNTQLLTLQTNGSANNSTAKDNGGYGFKVANSGLDLGSVSPYGANWSNYFDGSGDYLSVACPYLNDFPMTIEGWFYTDSVAAGFKTICSTRASAIDATSGTFSIGVNGAVLELYASGATVVSGGTVTAGTWNHFAVTRTGYPSTCTTKLYLNGSLVSTATNWNYGAPSLTLRLGDNAAGTEPWTGYISNFRFLVGTLQYNANFTPPSEPLQVVQGHWLDENITRLLLCGSNTFSDKSLNRTTVTRADNIRVQPFGPFKPLTSVSVSYSAYFDGGSYMQVGAFGSPPGQFGTNPFTVECWVYFTGATAPNASTFIVSTGGLSQGWGLYTNATPNFVVYLQGKSNGASITGTTTISRGVWYHVAISGARGGVKLFVNGVQEGSTYTGTTTDDINSMAVGKTISDATYSTKGYISNLRVVNGTALYTSNFSVPTAPLTAVANTQVLTCNSNTIRQDPSFNSGTYSLNVSGGPSYTTDFNPFGKTNTSASYSPVVYGGSIFNRSYGTQLVVTYDKGLSFPGDFTIEMWSYDLGGGFLNMHLLDWRNGNGAGWSGFVINRPDYGTSLVATINETSVITAAGTLIPSNQWTHVALVRSGTTITLYLNGVNAGTVTNSATITPNSTFTLGGNNYAFAINNYFQGYNTDVRVINGTAIYKKDFTPPATPLRAVKDTTLLLNFDNAAIVDYSMQNTLQTMANTKVFSSDKKYGSRSIKFDGTADYLQTSNTSTANYLTSASTNMLSGDFTFEGWIKLTGNQSSKYIIGTGILDGTFDRSIALIIGTTQKLEGYFSTDGSTWGSSITGTTTIAANTWVHVAFVKSGTTLKLFYNGVSEGTQTGTATGIARPNKKFMIGGCSSNGGTAYSYYFNGYMDDMRVTKGYARYSANFTPPTDTFFIK